MPGKTPETRSIGSSDYTVHPHGAVKGRALLLRLTKMMAPVFGGVTQANLGDKLSSVLDGFTEADLTFFCDEFAPKTFVNVDGGEIQLSKIFDLHFQDNYLEMVKWLQFAVEVNFGTFFREAATAMKDALKSAASAATAKAPASKA